jgi:UPF0755 protein
VKPYLGLGLLLLLVAGLGVSSAQWLFAAREPGQPARVFEVRNGESLHSLSRRLRDAGLLEDHVALGPRLLVWYARLLGVDRDVKSGEYDLSPSMAPAAILDKLVEGSVKTHPVTLREGLRLDEIAEQLEAAGIVKAEALLEAARDPELAQALGVDAPTLEGYLYPETYRFPRGTDPLELVETMHRQFRAAWTEEDERRLAGSGFTLHQVVTLASIVEKETARDEERPIIAAVFRNRLRRGMRLQTDPTVIYGRILLHGEFDGNLRRRDLDEDTPYNTYTRAGLPPGPIASAGIESIRAVLEPADVPYLYFVSRNDGTHVFSKTLREHNGAVDRYQRGKGRSSAANRLPEERDVEATPE